MCGIFECEYDYLGTTSQERQNKFYTTVSAFKEIIKIKKNISKKVNFNFNTVQTFEKCFSPNL